MSRSDRVLTAFLACLVSTSFVVYHRIDDVLSAIHPPGRAAHGLADLVPLTQFPEVDQAKARKNLDDILTFWLVNTGIFIPLLIVAYAWRGTRPLLCWCSWVCRCFSPWRR